MRKYFIVLVIAAGPVVPVLAQDVRGLEVCIAEKAMERRTSCLQSNVEFLQQALAKQARDTQLKLDAAGREAAAQKAQIMTLKGELARLQQELAELKKAKSEKK
ncbi:MAG TPA: hypothetical protein VEJ40_04475 [Pseudolabrys sp.]|nr:hypothetical protein [Pseudolabrys sp.]